MALICRTTWGILRKALWPFHFSDVYVCYLNCVTAKFFFTLGDAIGIVCSGLERISPWQQITTVTIWVIWIIRLGNWELYKSGRDSLESTTDISKNRPCIFKGFTFLIFVLKRLQCLMSQISARRETYYWLKIVKGKLIFLVIYIFSRLPTQ